MINNRNIEVEIRALVKNSSKLRVVIEKMGAHYEGESLLRDIYFCRKDKDSIPEVEMHKIGSYSLRLRKSRDTAGVEKITLNSKTIISEGDHNAWDEHEIRVDNFKESFLFLSETEFKPFFELKKVRHAYVLDNLQIFVEEIADLGSCIEVEIMTSAGKENRAKKEIFDFLEKIGIAKADVVPKSITNIVMKKRAFKHQIKP